MKRFVYAVMICVAMVANATACQINLNKVTAGELVQKLGIPMQQANLIVAYRKRTGKFVTTKELYNIRGLRDQVISQIREDANTCIE